MKWAAMWKHCDNQTVMNALTPHTQTRSSPKTTTTTTLDWSARQLQ